MITEMKRIAVSVRAYERLDLLRQEMSVEFGRYVTFSEALEALLYPRERM